MIDYSVVGVTGEDTPGAAKQFKFPAAVGGLNKRDGLADMPPVDANILTNMFPRPNYVELRRGFESYATDLPGTVPTLMEWAGPTARKFFAVSMGGIYDISSSGAVGAADVSSLSSSVWQYVNFRTAGGNFLIACSGSDDVLSYDGSSWATPSITGVTSADLINVTEWKNRLWFVEKNTQSAWYLPVDAIAGAASEQPIQFNLGGYLVAIGGFSYDSGDGPDDFIAFVSDQGEVVVYQGTDPTSATTFSKVGSFTIGAPIGSYRCLVKVGGDLAIITYPGVVSLIKSLNLDKSAAQQAAITNKIQDLFNQYAYTYNGNFGWCSQIYPRGQAVYFNVPLSSTQSIQLVMNTNTGSWCQYEGMNALCWGLYSDDIYFGGDGTVYKADSSRSDDGSNITFDYQSAWSDFGAKGQVKLFQEGVTLIVSNGSPALLQSFNVDFATTDPTGSLNPTAPPDSTWDTGLWDSARWGGDNSYFQWFSIGNIGTWGALRIQGAANGFSLRINAYTVSAEVGGAH